MPEFWERRKERWRKWWTTPLKWWEHVLVCVAAIIYSGIIGSILGILMGGVPIFPLDQLFIGVLTWAGSAAAIGGILAFLFPRVAFCVMYPFAFIGIGDVQVT